MVDRPLRRAGCSERPRAGWRRRPVRAALRRPRAAAGLLGFVGVGVALVTLTGAADAAASTKAPAKTSSSSTQLTWSSLSPPASPPALSYASAVYDGDTKTMVLFGGRRGNGTVSNDTWVWDGSTWTDYPGSRIQAPPARLMASMAFDPRLHQLILFGGMSADGQLLGDTWAWNGLAWYQETPPAGAPTPTPRELAAFTYDGNGYLVLFGGLGTEADSAAPASGADPAPTAPTSAPGQPASSTTTTSTTTPTTTTPSSGPTFGPIQGGDPTTSTTTGATTTVAPAAPPVTTTAAPISTVDLGDTWLWGPSGWQPSDVTGPSARAGAALAYDSTHHSVVLFGGIGPLASSGSASAPRELADTWLWSDGAWSRLAAATGPPARANALLADSPLTHGLVLFGGAGPSGVGGVLGDTWLWTGTDWAPADASGSPAPRTGAAGASDAASGKVVLFGGVGRRGVLYGDTQVLSTAPPVVIGPGTEPTTSTTRASTTLPGQSLPEPPSRARPTATTATGGSKVGSPSVPATSTVPLVANNRVLHRGDLVRLTAAGFRPGAAITITFHSAPEVVGRTTANSQGAFSATVAVPDRAALGSHHFEAQGDNPAGQTTTLVAAVDVVGLGGSSAPTTTQKLVLVAVALLLPLATWLALAGASGWRRRRAAVSASR